MSTEQALSWVRGQTEEWILSIADSDGTPLDLSTVLGIDLEVKPHTGAPDPAALALGIGTGIIVRSQTSPNVGVCDVVATSTQTIALAAGRWRYDVFVTRSDGARKLVVYGLLVVHEVVGIPILT